ncbi:hypothetical protein C1I95_19080 [Micromonospora craterilacus]|uniref:Pyrrolo-quinoline quinone repeat domain-containing protein n=1 Tax=Micromonospora craterilacus TaxID=1655439 RepID=A0A2W2EQ12_9ACTN|nr:PQQ-binding-like beta-propeller repeat protein [Micromonospora craterilacus]PZG15690.1 hypothetical protein C1I95_19080 [Micromonospora craterilacus]
MTLIDLGELAEPTDLELPRRRRPPSTRRWGAGVVALVVLLTLAGAAPPAARVHATLPGSLASDLILTEGYIFAVTPMPGVTGGAQELVAYPRPEHATVMPQRLAPLWRVPVPPANHISRAMPVADGGVLLSMVVPERSDNLETVLLDIRTGQQRWRAPGFATLDGSGRALLRTFAEDEQVTVRSVEVASGRELWSAKLAFAPLNYQQWDSMTDAVVVFTVAGDVEVRDPETGAVRHRLPRPGGPAGDPQTWLAGDLVLVIRDAGTITAYSVDGLAQRWQTTVPRADYANRCGAMICVGSGDAVDVLDPETGAVEWRSTEDVDVLLVGDVRAVASRRSNNLELVALDVTTGGVLTDYGAWALVSPYGESPQLLGTRVVPEVGLVLARFDPAEPQPRRVDVLAGAVDGCQYGYGLIACRREDGSFGVWQLRGGGERA